MFILTNVNLFLTIGKELTEKEGSDQISEVLQDIFSPRAFEKNIQAKLKGRCCIDTEELKAFAISEIYRDITDRISTMAEAITMT